MSSSLRIALNINERQITAVLVRLGENLSIERDTSFTRSYQIDSQTNPREIIAIWIECLEDLLREFLLNFHEDETIDGIAIGMPNPMDYDRAICQSQSNSMEIFFALHLRLALQCELKNLVARWRKTFHWSTNKTKSIQFLTPVISTPTGKTSAKDFCGRQDFEDEIEPMERKISQSRRETYFHDVEIPLATKRPSSLDEISPKLQSMIERLPMVPITFHNDTFSFALAEGNFEQNKNYDRILVLTLNSTLGSAFLDRGQIIVERSDVPLDGSLANCPYDHESIADDWFSLRGLMKIYEKLLGKTTSISLETLARRAALNEDFLAQKAFETFARLLGQFLVPYVEAFRTQLILIGGELALHWPLINNELFKTLQSFSSVQLDFSFSTNKSICLGAVRQQLFDVPNREKTIRSTDQPVLPSISKLFPSHRISSTRFGIGSKALNEKVFPLIEKHRILLVDGSIGSFFDQFAENLNEFSFQEILLFYDARSNLELVKKNFSSPAVVIGPGASLFDETSPLVYVDLPRKEFSSRSIIENSSLNNVLSRLDFFVDGQRPRCVTWIDGETLRQTLKSLSKEPIRFRPRSKRRIDFIPSETGLILSDLDDRLLEISWPFFFVSQSLEIFGNEIHHQMFSAFPIRLSFVSKINGDFGANSLALQVTCDSPRGKENLSSHGSSLFDVHRLEIPPDENLPVTRRTEKRFHLCVLIAGEAIDVEFPSNETFLSRRFFPMEIFLITGSIDEYRLRPVVSRTQLDPLIFLVVYLR